MVGGSSGNSSVTFYGNKRCCTATRLRNGSIKTTTGNIKHVTTIPVVRGIVSVLMSVYVVLCTSKGRFNIVRAVQGIVAVFMMSYVIDITTSSIRVGSQVYASIVLFVATVLYVKFSKTSKYHAAEHKVAHCCENKLELNISNCDNQSAVHKRCGTNFVVLCIPALCIIANADIDNSLHTVMLMLLCIGLLSEVYFAKIISWPGMIVQRLFTTGKAEDKHIEVAISAMNGLLSVEPDCWSK